MKKEYKITIEENITGFGTNVPTFKDSFEKIVSLTEKEHKILIEIVKRQ